MTPEWYSTRARAPHLEEAGHVWRLHAAADLVFHAIEKFDVKTVSDLGAGDGGLLSLIDLVKVETSAQVDAWGYDLQPTNIAGAAERGVNVTLGNFLTDEIEYGDLSVVTEVLEHLEDPHGFLRNLPSDLLVASSPSTETAEHHYEFHVWAWDYSGFESLLTEGGYTTIKHLDETGCQVVLARR